MATLHATMPTEMVKILEIVATLLQDTYPVHKGNFHVLLPCIDVLCRFKLVNVLISKIFQGGCSEFLGDICSNLIEMHNSVSNTISPPNI